MQSWPPVQGRCLRSLASSRSIIFQDRPNNIRWDCACCDTEESRPTSLRVPMNRRIRQPASGTGCDACCNPDGIRRCVACEGFIHQIALNQDAGGLRVSSEIVPEITEVFWLHTLHLKSPAARRHDSSWPQAGQRNPFGQRNDARSLRHASLLEKFSSNSVRSFGYASVKRVYHSMWV